MIQVPHDVAHGALDVLVRFSDRRDVAQGISCSADAFEARDQPRREICRRQTSAGGGDVAAGAYTAIISSGFFGVLRK